MCIRFAPKDFSTLCYLILRSSDNSYVNFKSKYPRDLLTMSRTEHFKKDCPELRELPQGWKFEVAEKDGCRIYFVNPANKSTWNHPTLGALPDPWVLKVKCHTNRALSPEYHNPNTKVWTKRDPRWLKESLAEYKNSVPKTLRTAASSVRNTGIKLEECQRMPIGKNNIRDEFEVVHTIDPGDGSVGQMNSGIFVVRIKNTSGRLFVEKRFKDDDVGIARTEIMLCHRVKHAALTAYFAGFISDSTRMGSLYVEFCDRGSLQGLIDNCMKERKNFNNNRIYIPEGFVWHAFIGLCDGFAYLQGGRSFLNNKGARPVPGWIPILHRDMKPDNVLLRSRTTLNSRQYFYCVLSDFGLACENRKKYDPLADRAQLSGAKLGTRIYFAPELLYKPYPIKQLSVSNPNREFYYFPNGYAHSAISDVWALGACLYTLCDPPPQGQYATFLNTNKHSNVDSNAWYDGTISRYDPLDIPSFYTRELKDAVNLATTWYPARRPDPISLIGYLEGCLRRSGFSTANALDPKHKLPDWATKVHGFYAKAEQISSHR